MPHSEKLYGRIPSQPHGGPARCTPTPCTPTQQLPTVPVQPAPARADAVEPTEALAPVSS